MNRKLNRALWIVAGILAIVFLVASSTKVFVPRRSWPVWAAPPPGLRRVP
jgi:uncharacterized membrane protein